MKKLIFLVPFLIFSCGESGRMQPVGKYKSCVLIENPNSGKISEHLWVKNKDSVFEIIVPSIDVEKLKAGDTIK